MLTINGRVQLWRRRWYSPEEGTTTPLDQWLDTVESTISLGVREMACRLNGDGKNFDKAAANLARTAQVKLSGETLRVLVETEGKRVLQAQRSGQLAVDWSAADCQTEQKTTRVYFGSDGVMVPLVTDAEKTSRRQKVKEKRRQRGKKARPLPPRKAGADQHYKEFKIVAFYDETQEHRLVSGTRGDHEAAGRLMRREAGRIRFDLADEKVGNVDGSPWIRNQVKRQCLPLDDLGLDFYHLSENVHKARREIYGEDDEAGKQWADKLLHTFKHDGYEPTWQQLLEWRVGLRRGQRPGGGSALELRQRATGDDQVSGVPCQGLADRQRPDGGDLQDADGTAEGLGDALGCRQRRGPHGPGGSDAKRPMGRVLEKSATANGLSTPGSFARHRRAKFQYSRFKSSKPCVILRCRP